MQRPLLRWALGTTSGILSGILFFVMPMVAIVVIVIAVLIASLAATPRWAIAGILTGIGVTDATLGGIGVTSCPDCIASSSGWIVAFGLIAVLGIALTARLLVKHAVKS